MWEDPGLIPGLGTSSREGTGYPLQYSCLENPMTEEPGRLHFKGSQRVRHYKATNIFTSFPNKTQQLKLILSYNPCLAQYLFDSSFSKGQNPGNIFELCISTNIRFDKKIDQQSSRIQQLYKENILENEIKGEIMEKLIKTE